MIVEDVGAWSEVAGYDYEHEEGATSVAGLADGVIDASAMYAPGAYSQRTATAALDVGSWWDDLSGIVQGGINAYRDRKSRRAPPPPGVVPGGYGSGPTVGSPPVSRANWMPIALGAVAVALLVRR